MTMTLSDYLDDLQQNGIQAELTALISQICQACQQIDRKLQQGALAGVLGNAGSENIQGESQKKLDVIANNILLEQLKTHPSVAALASEEMDDIVLAQPNAPYTVVFDPLDGSSNIDINMCVGTIFSVIPAPKKTALSNQDALVAGNEQVAAGYVLYGPSTMLALTVGQGTDIFSFDPDRNQFVLTHPKVSIEQQTQEYAINGSNQRHWEQPVQRYINELNQGKTGVRGKDFNTRWVACMVGDIHRILIRGGIFLYPYDHKDPTKAGKLRLLYEANPMSMLVEQAGGESSTARESILNIQPHDLHQRVPVVIGCKQEVELVAQYHREAL